MPLREMLRLDRIIRDLNAKDIPHSVTLDSSRNCKRITFTAVQPPVEVKEAALKKLAARRLSPSAFAKALAWEKRRLEKETLHSAYESMVDVIDDHGISQLTNLGFVVRERDASPHFIVALNEREFKLRGREKNKGKC